MENCCSPVKEWSYLLESSDPLVVSLEYEIQVNNVATAADSGCDMCHILYQGIRAFSIWPDPDEFSKVECQFELDGNFPKIRLWQWNNSNLRTIKLVFASSPETGRTDRLILPHRLDPHKFTDALRNCL